MNGWVGNKLGLDTDLTLYLDVKPYINPDDKKNPSPLYIRMYELKSSRKFDRADFLSIYERDKEVLGTDFIAKQELKRLIPGESRKEYFVLNKETKYIALFGEFLKYKNATFKVVTPVVSNNVFASYVSVQVNGNNLEIVDIQSTDK
jgi:type VI secretion system protein VasD